MVKEINKKDKNKIKKEIYDEVLNEIKEKVKKDTIKEIKKDVIKSIKEDSISKLQDEFVDEVKNDVKQKIHKEEKKLLRVRNFKIINRDIIIILLLCVIGFLGYLLLNDKYVIKKKEDSVKVSKIEDVKDKDWYINKYSYLLDLTHLKLSNDNINKLYLYKKNYNSEDINKSIKLTMAYNLLKKEDIIIKDNKYEVSSDKLKKAYEKLFDEEYSDTNFNIDCMTYIYKNKKYSALKQECNDINDYEVQEKITNIYEENGNIIIETSLKTDDNIDASIVNNYKYTFKNKKFKSIEKVIN